MSEEEKTHAQLIEDIISNKMKPIYWLIGILVLVFTTVSVPLTTILIQTVAAQGVIQETKLDKKEAESFYLNKMNYYQIEEDEHRMALELAPDVNKATNVYNRINDNTRSSLGFKYTTRGGEDEGLR